MTVTVHRTASHVAPEMVFFDATAYTHASTSYPFLDLQFIWNFGDSEAGNWQATNGTVTGRSKNAATRGVAAHVYETAGTYTPRVTVFSALGVLLDHIVLDPITVTAADTYYATTSTVCVSNDTDHTGAPTGATLVDTSSDLDALIATHAGTNKRILLHDGDTFTASAMSTLTHSGMTFGKYGAGADPIIEGGAFTLLRLDGSDDLRVIDWDYRGGNTEDDPTTAYIDSANGASQVLVLRGSSSGSRTPILHGIESGDAAELNQFGVVEHAFTGMGTADSYNIFIAASYLAVMGCTLDNLDGSHNLRMPWVKKFVVSDNVFTRGKTASHQIKLHGPTWATELDYSEYGVISYNKFDSESVITVAIGPQDGISDERVRQVIEECNWYVMGAAGQCAVVFWAHDCVGRSSVIDASLASNTQNLVQVQLRGVEPDPENVRLYNYTCFSSKAVPSNQFHAVTIGADAVDCVVKNIVAWAPNATSPHGVDDSGTDTVVSNNSTDDQVKNTQPFTSATPSDPADFAPIAYALTDADSTTSALDDYFGNYRGSVREMGAVEVGTEDYPEEEEESSVGLPQRLGKPRRRRTFVDLQDKLVEVSGFQEAERLLGQLKTEEKLQEKERKRLKILLGRVDDRKTGVLYEATQKQIVSLEKKMDKRDERIEKLSELILKKLEESNEDDEEVLLLS